MNEEKINVCRALASIFLADEEVTDEEVAFIGRTALDLGLDEGELKIVQQALSAPLDTKELLATINDPNLRRFFFRRVVAATLIDAHLSDKEKEIVDVIIDGFGWDKAVATSYMEHMQQFIEMEKKGEEIISHLS